MKIGISILEKAWNLAKTEEDKKELEFIISDISSRIPKYKNDLENFQKELK